MHSLRWKTDGNGELGQRERKESKNFLPSEHYWIWYWIFLALLPAEKTCGTSVISYKKFKISKITDSVSKIKLQFKFHKWVTLCDICLSLNGLFPLSVFYFPSTCYNYMASSLIWLNNIHTSAHKVQIWFFFPRGILLIGPMESDGNGIFNFFP